MLKISKAPFIRSELNVDRVMYDVIVALLPIIAFAIYTFGNRVAVHILLACLTAFITEFVFIKVLKRDFTVFDGSSFLSVILLVLTLPHIAPYWISSLGAFLAVLFGKMVFGGLGRNIFNPALLARIILSTFFPAHIFTYSDVDGTAGATLIPTIHYSGLDDVIYSFDNMFEFFKHIFFGLNRSGSMGETSVFLILIAMLFLGFRKHILFRVPILIILTVVLLGFVIGINPLVYISYGGLMFAAVFMATDMVTSPYTKKGLIFYSISIGALTVFIREFTSMKEGVTSAILIMNFFTPMIDQFFRDRVYGQKKDNRERNSFFITASVLGVATILVYFCFGVGEIEIKDRTILKRREVVKNEFLKGRTLGSEVLEADGLMFVPVYNGDNLESYYVEADSKGYSTKRIYYSMLLSLDGKIKEFRIIKQNETFRLGSNIGKLEWQNKWIDRDKDYEFNRELDGFAGATYSSYNLYKSVIFVLTSFVSLNSSEEDSDDFEGWGDEEEAQVEEDGLEEW